MYKTQGRVENFKWEGKLGREREAGVVLRALARGSADVAGSIGFGNEDTCTAIRTQEGSGWGDDPNKIIQNKMHLPTQRGAAKIAW